MHICCCIGEETLCIVGDSLRRSTSTNQHIEVGGTTRLRSTVKAKLLESSRAYEETPDASCHLLLLLCAQHPLLGQLLP